MFDTNSSRVGFEDLHIIAHGAIGASLTPIPSIVDGTFPAQHAIRAIKVINDTDVPMILSYTGINPQEYIPAKSGYSWDIATNRMEPSGIFQLPRFTIFYVTYYAGAPTTGVVAVTIMYGAVN